MNTLLAQVYKSLENRFKENFEELRRWIQIESTAATGQGIQDGVNYVFDLYRKLPGTTEIIELKNGFPVVLSEIKSKNPKAKTVIHYNKYDANPADELDWTIPPYSATVINAEDVPGLPHHLGQVVVGRGSADSKAPHFADVKAIEAMIDVTDDIPVNLYLISEGEHEIGSPNLHQLNEIKRLETIFKKADCFMQMSSNRGGSEKMGMDMSKAQIRLGCKGSLWCEVSVKGGEWGGPIERDLETEGTWIDSPVWRLIWAINSLKDPSGRITLDGFYDDIRPLTVEERELGVKVRDQVFNENEWKRLYGIKKFRNGLRGKDLFLDWIYAPDIEIIGFQSGYTGPKLKSFFPKSANAKLVIRLQPNQKPQKILWQLKKHLHTQGFSEVDVSVAANYPPMRTSVKTQLAQSMINAVKRIGLDPVTWPNIWAGAPYSVIVHAPYAGCSGISGGHFHQANEYVVVNTILDGMKLMATWCYEFAGLLKTP